MNKKISIDFSKIRGTKYLRTKRTRTLLLRTIEKHFRTKNMKISQLLNQELWKYGLEGAGKTEVAFLENNGFIWAYLPMEKPETFLPKPKVKKEEKPKKEEAKNEKEKEVEKQKEEQKKVVETERKMQAGLAKKNKGV